MTLYYQAYAPRHDDRNIKGCILCCLGLQTGHDSPVLES
jgi:hypothetical protein